MQDQGYAVSQFQEQGPQQGGAVANFDQGKQDSLDKISEDMENYEKLFAQSINNYIIKEGNKDVAK